MYGSFHRLMRRKLTYFIAAATAALTFACSQASPTPTISPTSTPTIEAVIAATPAPSPTPAPTPQHTATPTPDAAYQLKVSDTKNDIYAILKDAIGIQKRSISIASSIDEILASEKGRPYSPKDYHPLDEEVLDVISSINDLKTLNVIKRVAIEINTIESRTEGILNNARVIAVRNKNAVGGFSNTLKCSSLTPLSNPPEFRLPDYYASSGFAGSEVLSYMASVLLTAKDLEEETASFNDSIEAREGYINNCRNYYLGWISGLSANTNTHQTWTAQVVSDNRAIAMQISDAAIDKHSTGQVFLATDFVDQKSPFHTRAYDLNLAFLEGIIARLEEINAVVTRTLDTAKDSKAITTDTYEMLKGEKRSSPECPPNRFPVSPPPTQPMFENQIGYDPTQIIAYFANAVEAVSRFEGEMKAYKADALRLNQSVTDCLSKVRVTPASPSKVPDVGLHQQL